MVDLLDLLDLLVFIGLVLLHPSVSSECQQVAVIRIDSLINVGSHFPIDGVKLSRHRGSKDPIKDI